MSKTEVRHFNTMRRFLEGVDVETLTIIDRTGSPWLCFNVWVHLRGEYEFGMWKQTERIYQGDEQGAMSDDPITEFPTDDPPKLVAELRRRGFR